MCGWAIWSLCGRLRTFDRACQNASAGVRAGLEDAASRPGQASKSTSGHRVPSQLRKAGPFPVGFSSCPLQ